MGLFKRKKKNKQKNTEIEEQEIELQTSQEPSGGHLVLEHCETMIEAARELERGRREYNNITEYLTDIETIADLPASDMAPIRECAENINRLKASRDEYLNTNKTISDDQFNMMASIEAEAVDIIKRMQANETYQSTVKKDMSYLEGEKLQWTKRREDLIREQKHIKTGAFAALGIFVVTIIVLLVLMSGFRVNIILPMMILVLLGAIAGFVMMIRYNNAGAEIKKAKINADHAIALLNRTKIKYVNITNAVDYSLDRYGVKNAREMEYIWEQYMDAIRQQERYERNSDELEFFTGRLLKLIKPLRLYDPVVWKDRSEELLRPGELSELKHNFLERRRKINNNMEYNLNVIDEEKTTVLRIVSSNPRYKTEVDEIFASVDKIVGTKDTKR